MAMPSNYVALAHDFSTPVEIGFEPVTLASAREHGGDIYGAARALGLAPSEIVDFSASINPLGPPRSARRAFTKSYAEISHYPHLEGSDLREALARRHGLNPEKVLLGNGSAQLIYLICRALRPKSALVVHPAFCEYAHALELVGCAVRSYRLSADEEFRFCLTKLEPELRRELDLIFLANPNSVTGGLVPRSEIEELASLALRKRFFLVIDEAFIDFIEEESANRLLRANPYLIILRSLTKYYGLPGLRIGYLLGNEKIVRLLAHQQEPWSVNLPAQRVALACLGDEGFKSRTNRWLQGERKFLLKGLRRIPGLLPYPSRANFILVGCDRSPASEVRAFLLQRKILIRVCDSFLGLGKNFFRVAVRRRNDNRRLLKGLEEFTKSALCNRLS